MRFIRKKPSPQAFEDWKRANKPADWSDLMNEPTHREEDVLYYTKDELRSTLLAEQGHLCCYCQRRIENTESTVIEHLFPRNGEDKMQGKAKTFEYSNLMASCDGGALANRDRNKKEPATPSYPEYCDRSKQEKLLPLSPLDPDVESRFTYSIADDKVNIVGKDPEAISTIQEILNLNTPFLEKRRGEAIAGLIFEDQEKLQFISIETAKKLLVSYQQQEDNAGGHLSEFFRVKLHFLQLFSGDI
ncbi:MAG: TIGR02646 family protein [Saprospiraceae bacterium]|nr:TIGR02646 family protein [Saprospiraceae bacterium]